FGQERSLGDQGRGAGAPGLGTPCPDPRAGGRPGPPVAGTRGGALVGCQDGPFLRQPGAQRRFGPAHAQVGLAGGGRQHGRRPAGGPGARRRNKGEGGTWPGSGSGNPRRTRAGRLSAAWTPSWAASRPVSATAGGVSASAR